MAGRVDWQDGRVRGLGLELGVALALAVVLGLLGPFGTYAMPLAPRLGKWLLFILGGFVFFRPVTAAGSVVAAHTWLPRLAAIALANLLAAMPTTLLVAWLLVGGDVTRVGLAGLAELYGDVVIVGLVMTAVQLAMNRTPGGTTVAPAAGTAGVEAPAPSAALPRLAARLPDDWGGRVIAISNEDHYVRVHVAEASMLVLMRMSDAVAEMDGVDGARVHRGWWVARGAVAGVERRGRAVWLRLANGLEAPVARNMAAALRQQGWL